jgi:hypothetical protein
MNIHRPSMDRLKTDENIVPNKRPENAVKIYVYGDLSGDGANTRVRIGNTIQDRGKRRKQHEHRGPLIVKMRWLVGVWGFPSDETALLQYWKNRELAENGDWFRVNEEMRAWLRWLGDQNFAAKNEEDMEITPFVDARYWMPDNSTHIKILAPQQMSFDNVLRHADPWDDLETAIVMDGDYYTHEAMISAARETMGEIDLDPASCRAANWGVKNGKYNGVRAKKFFGIKEDGLTRQWAGNVWLNPPFGQWDQWAPKAITELKSGRILQMCVFCTASSSTGQSIHTLVAHANAIFIPCGRFGCWGPKASAPQDGNLIFYFGPNKDQFCKAFSQYGTVFWK